MTDDDVTIMGADLYAVISPYFGQPADMVREEITAKAVAVIEKYFVNRRPAEDYRPDDGRGKRQDDHR